MAQKTALVTGGTGSIGEELVRQLVEAGYKTTFQYAANDARARELSQATGASAIKLDFQSPAYPDVMQFDALVNSAAISDAKSPVHETSELELREHLEINLIAAFNLIRRCLPYMLERHWGRIVNIGSIYSLRGCARNVSYNVSKHALSGLTKSVALDYAAQGITCNEVCPSAVDSKLMQRIANDKYLAGGSAPADFLREVALANPMRRMATPRDVAEVVVYLLADAAAFINGVSIPVDGGEIT
jgi:NAD(P)-dependent dehydrogenase (short-subunit alcohol dehydrogenase family)